MKGALVALVVLVFGLTPQAKAGDEGGGSRSYSRHSSGGDSGSSNNQYVYPQSSNVTVRDNQPASTYYPRQNSYQSPSVVVPYNSYNYNNYRNQNSYYGAPASELRPATGRTNPAVMVEFSEKFSAVVSNYINAQYQLTQGYFLIKDDQTGETHRLKLKKIHKDRVYQTAANEAFGCLELESAAGGRTLDLDFYLNKDDLNWNVSKIYIHAVDGKPRYAYDSRNQIVGLETSAPARAPAARAPSQPPSFIPKPKAPARLTAVVSFSEPSGNDRLDGDETGKLRLALSNAGPGPAYALRLTARLRTQSSGLGFADHIELGDLRAGKSVSAELPLMASPDIPNQNVKLELVVKEGNGFDAEPILVEFETRALKAPRLELAGVALRVGQVVKAGENTTLTVTVRNSGAGPAKNASAALILGSPDLFLSGEASAALGTLEPGQTKTADFEFFVNKRFKGPAIPVSVSLTESKGRYGIRGQSLGLVLGKAPSGQILAVSGKGSEEQAAEAPENVDVPPRTRTKIDPEAYAVVIGIEKYRDVPGVDFAARDAEAVHAYLTRAMGFDARNTVLLTNERATLTDLATYLGPWLEDRVSDKSRVFIFYAGHGAPEPKSGQAYLIPYDGNPNYNETKAYSLSRLYQTLAKLPAREITVALDSCFSGAGGRSVLAKGARPLVHMRPSAPLGPNSVVLSAASGEQISTYYPEAQHGLLTYFLLKGLRGAADSDKNSEITTSELFTYLQPVVSREARKQHIEQTPTLNPAPESLGDKGSWVWLRMR